MQVGGLLDVFSGGGGKGGNQGGAHDADGQWSNGQAVSVVMQPLQSVSHGGSTLLSFVQPRAIKHRAIKCCLAVFKPSLSSLSSLAPVL